TSSGPPLSRVIRPKGARLLKCCAHGERFLIHSAGPTPSTALTAPTIALGASPLPPSRGEALRPRGFSHRRGDAKSLVYLDISRHFTVHLFSTWMPSSARGKGGGPRRFTAIVLNVGEGVFEGPREWNPNRPVSRAPAGVGR